MKTRIYLISLTLILVSIAGIASLCAEEPSLTSGTLSGTVTSSTGTTFTVEKRDVKPIKEMVRLTPEGKWEHHYNVTVKIQEMTPTSLVLECDDKKASGIYSSRWGGIIIDEEYREWREYYSVRNGKLTLDRIIIAKKTPAVPAKPAQTDWDAAEVEVIAPQAK